MKKVHIESKRAGDRRVIEISIGGITARYRAIGDLSELKATGRGNVRQLRRCYVSSFETPTPRSFSEAP